MRGALVVVWLGVVVGCAPWDPVRWEPACGAAACTVREVAHSAFPRLYVHEDHVYWEVTTSTGALLQRMGPLGTDRAEPVGPTAGGRTLVLFGDSVFFIEPYVGMERVLPPAEDVLTVPDPLANVVDAAADGRFIYLLQDDGDVLSLGGQSVETVSRFDPSTGDRMPLATGAGTPVRIVLGPTHIFWHVVGGTQSVLALPREGDAAPAVLAGGLQCVRDIVANETAVFFAHGCDDEGSITRISLADGQASTLVRDAYPHALALDGELLYFATGLEERDIRVFGQVGRIRSIPVDGGDPVTMFSTASDADCRVSAGCTIRGLAVLQGVIFTSVYDLAQETVTVYRVRHVGAD